MHELRIESLIAGTGDAQTQGIRGLASSAKTACEGDLYFCVGEEEPGEGPIKEDILIAADRRVAAIVTDLADIPAECRGVPVFQVKDVRKEMVRAARVFYGEVDRKLKLLGVTGTNGKSTTTHLVRHLVEAIRGKPVGLLGTVEYALGGRVVKSPNRTTPICLDNYKLLAEMVENGCEVACMEVSSHGIELGRLDGLEFLSGGFLNLSAEHLDFHGDMEGYFATKRSWFEGRCGVKPKHAVVSVCGEYGRRLVESVDREATELLTVGIECEADLVARGVKADAEGLRFEVEYAGECYGVRSGLLGAYNVENILMGLGQCLQLGFGLEELVKALESFKGVCGRMERVHGLGAEVQVFVDYAHTPEAFEKTLGFARDLTKGKVWVVFGCGGQRDRGCRGQMGQAVDRLADRCVLTQDNPRGEPLEQIYGDILKGFERLAPEIVDDRAQAIEMAVREARAGDTVLILGKGHQKYQECVAGVRDDFDDVELARAALEH